jgi:hypothetical protein
MIHPVLAHGSGVDDIGLFLVGAVLSLGLWLTVRRMRALEASNPPPAASAAPSDPARPTTDGSGP